MVGRAVAQPSRWKLDETLADAYDLTVPPDTPSGPYRLLVILYELDTLAKVGRAELESVPYPGDS